MGNGIGASKVAEAGVALRHYTYYRPTILLLLKQHESYGYELSGRIAELGFDQRMTASLYGVLRDMETEKLITSSWDLSERGGPPRRVYALTATGEQFLHDSVPTLTRQRQALDAMLDLYATLDQERLKPASVGTLRRRSNRRLGDGNGLTITPERRQQASRPPASDVARTALAPARTGSATMTNSAGGGRLHAAKAMGAPQAHTAASPGSGGATLGYLAATVPERMAIDELMSGTAGAKKPSSRSKRASTADGTGAS